MHKRRILTVEKVVQETHDAVSIHFAQPGTDKVWYRPGQYLTLVVDLDGRPVYRCYSISTAPRLDSTLGITLKLTPGGVLSPWLVREARPGMKIDAIDPRGRFFTDISIKNRRRLVFFAAGSGISPVYSMLRSVLFGEPNSQVALWYVNRSPEQAIFLTDLIRLQRMFPQRFVLQLIYTSSSGRMTGQEVEAIGRRFGQDGIPTTYWLCGPDGFMRTVVDALKKSDSGPVFFESFDLAAEEAADLAFVEGLSPQDVKVSHAGVTHQFRVPAGATILEAATGQGIELPHSCKRGVCSACVAHVRAGTVRLAKPDLMLEFEVQRGLTLLCQAYPLDSELDVTTGF